MKSNPKTGHFLGVTKRGFNERVSDFFGGIKF